MVEGCSGQILCAWVKQLNFIQSSVGHHSGLQAKDSMKNVVDYTLRRVDETEKTAFTCPVRRQNENPKEYYQRHRKTNDNNYKSQVHGTSSVPCS